jgi:hypothetical protein
MEVLATFQALQHASEYDARWRILVEWYGYAAYDRAKNVTSHASGR